MKFKEAIILVSIGLFLGTILSPFTDSTPKEAIKSPISEGFAFEKEEVNYVENEDQGNELGGYLAFFDDQQDFYKQRILGAKTEANKVEEENIMKINTESGNKKIAFYGDSMIDTMGTGLPYFENAISKFYPNISWSLRNYGIGAESIGKGLARIDSSYIYKDRDYAAVTSEHFDIIILGSFAYNPYEETEIEKYKNEMRETINKLKGQTNNLIFLATIAPLKIDFGKGPGGVNWDSDTAYTHATKIQKYMEAGIEVARNENLPVIDIYHQTLQTNGEGISDLVSSHDGIHPSENGHKFIASKISEFIVNNIEL